MGGGGGGLKSEQNTVTNEEHVAFRRPSKPAVVLN